MKQNNMKIFIGVVVLSMLTFTLYAQNDLEIKPDRIDTIYYENGEIFIISSYKNEKKNGEYIQFHENGALSVKYYYINDLIVDGKYISYREDSTVMSEGMYKNGSRKGKWYYYFSNKSISKIEVYRRGSLKKSIIYDVNGKKDFVIKGQY